ncbi:MAG: D-alanyl-D-alanine carboxypeptidase family protein [Candidatus Krumholzibacteriia bacterium]
MTTPRPDRPARPHTGVYRRFALFCVVCAICAGPLAGVGGAVAAPLPADGDFAAAIVVDAASGEVLMARNPHEQRPPASMTKMMTELVVLEKVAAGELALTDTVTVSGHAAKIGGSQVYLKDGEKFTVEDLLRAVTIHSANDAATALAEHVAGSTDAFVELMNARAQELGMKDTVFHSCHGLPPARGQLSDVSSAFDMALLCKALLAHPESTRWASQAEAPFRGGEFTLHNPNGLVGKFPGLDGMKTGYTVPAGFCLTATAQQRGARLISVVMGAKSGRARAAETARLLTRGFALYTQVKLVDSANKPLEAHVRVKGGAARDVVVAYAKPLSVLVLKGRSGSVVLENRLPDRVTAPLKPGQVVGKAVATLDGKVLGEVPIIALEAVDRGSFLQRLFG